MRIKIYYTSIIALVLFGCSKDDDRLVKGAILDKFTNKPISGLDLMFDVALGTFGSNERNKYLVTTDSDGKFEFLASSTDASGTFYISNDYEVIYSDSISDAAMHIIDYSDTENTYLFAGQEKYIKYTPSGVVGFYILKTTILQLDFDTILIKSKYEEKIISFLREYDYEVLTSGGDFYVEPSQYQKFEIYKIDNGVETLYDELNFYVFNYNYNIRKPTGGKIKMEILRK